jgi:hypothetical protein
VLLKIGDLLPGQRNGHLLLLLEILTLLNQFVVMGLRLFITHKSIDPLSNRLHVGLVKDRLAELARLLHHGRFFDGRLHIDFCFAIPRGHLCHWTRRRNNTPHPGKKCKRRVLSVLASRASTSSQRGLSPPARGNPSDPSIFFYSDENIGS